MPHQLPRDADDNLVPWYRADLAQGISVEREALDHVLPVIGLEWFGRMLEAYGPERIVWASDHTQGLRPDFPVRTFSWAESLYYLFYSGIMSQSEKEWVFGKALRQILRWDPAAQIW